MRRSLPYLLGSILCLIAPAAQAGAVRCRLEQGVLIAPAQIGDIAGDYIIDTGARHSMLAETQAQAAGLEGAQASLHGRFAGQELGGHLLDIAALDARTARFVTPIAGVIGIDVLSAYVVDIRFSPCWIAVHAPDRPYPRFAFAQRAPMTWTSGVPTTPVGVSDGARSWRVDLTLATGLDAPVRLAYATVTPTKVPAPDLRAYGPARAKLRALSFGGALYENLAAGLAAPEDGAGAIGAQILSRFRLRIDFPNNELQWAPH